MNFNLLHELYAKTVTSAIAKKKNKRTLCNNNLSIVQLHETAKTNNTGESHIYEAKVE